VFFPLFHTPWRIVSIVPNAHSRLCVTHKSGFHGVTTGFPWLAGFCGYDRFSFICDVTTTVCRVTLQIVFVFINHYKTRNGRQRTPWVSKWMLSPRKMTESFLIPFEFRTLFVDLTKPCHCSPLTTRPVRYALFWDVVQRMVVIPYRRLGTDRRFLDP
jgi:hypothetical protein